MNFENLAEEVKGDRLAKAIAESEDVDELVSLETELTFLYKDCDCQMTERSADLGAFEQECRRDQQTGKQRYFEKEAEYKSWKSKAHRWQLSVWRHKELTSNRLRSIQQSGPKTIERRVYNLEQRVDALEREKIE